MQEKKLPEGWQLIKFGDIAKHISKRVEPSKTDLDIYVGLEHLDPNSLKIKRHGAPSDVDGQKLLVKKGQIIFGKRRAYQRKVAVADWDCICSAHAMVLEAIPDKVIPEFLPFFMQSDIFMNRAVEISEGSLSPTIKWKILAEQTFKFPNKEKQKQLIKLFQLIEKNIILSNVLLNSVLIKKTSLMNELVWHNKISFKDYVEWKKGKLKDIAYVSKGKSLSSKNVLEGNYPVIAGGKTSPYNHNAYTHEKVITVSASGANAGFVSFHPYKIWASDCSVIRPNEDSDILFIYYLLENIQEKIYRLQKGGAQPHVYPRDLETIEIVIPPLNQQKKIVFILVQIDEEITIIKNKIKSLENIKRNILLSSFN